MDEILECPICSHMLTDPRVLPCGHTYCLPCMHVWSVDKRPGDKLDCPECRQEFIVPSNGVADLPKNFFAANFLQMKQLSSKTGHCEACGGGEVTEKKVATVYCVECQQKLCQTCEEYHRKFTVTRRHSIVNVNEDVGETPAKKPRLDMDKAGTYDDTLLSINYNIIVALLQSPILYMQPSHRLFLCCTSFLSLRAERESSLT